MPTCAIYARVSDELQVEGESVAHQISFMREFARRRSEDGGEPWVTPDAFVYKDEGISGTSIIKRPAVQQMINDAKAKRFEIVLFKGISRFARDTVDSLVMLRTLQACGLRVISFEENFDSARDNAELIFTMHSAVAQYESEKIGIRVRLGNFEKARAGKWSGPAPDGYKLNKETKRLEIDPVRAPIIQKMFSLYEQGYGFFKVAETLNNEGFRTKSGGMWTNVKVSRIITNPVYAGDVVYGLRERKLLPPSDNDPLARKYHIVFTQDYENVAICRDAHPPLIPRELFEALQERKESRIKTKGRIGEEHLLSGIIKCKCGGSMTIKTNHIGRRYYRCQRKYSRSKTLCDQPFIRADDLESEVLEQVRKDIIAKLNPEVVKDRRIKKTKQQDFETQLQAIKAELDKEMQKSISLFDKYMDGVISEDQFQSMNKVLKERVQSLTKTKDELERKRLVNQNTDDSERRIKEMMKRFLEADEVNREWLRTLVREVRITPDVGFQLVYAWG